MEIKTKIDNITLKEPEDMKFLNEICEEIKEKNIQNEIIIDLLKIIEKNPNYNFGNPGNLVRIIEKYTLKDYEEKIIQSIERVPTEYNLWLLNRQLNSYETLEERKNGINLFKRILKETEETKIKEILKNFLSDYEI